MNRVFTLVLLGCSTLYGVGCSSTPTGTDAGQDSGGNDTGTQEAGNDGAAPINGCTTYTDDTADGGIITGPSGATAAQYQPACVHIKTGQKVTWNSDFTNHPLVPTTGVGTQPNPISATSSGTTVTVTFPSAGTFAYNCGIHTSSMLGAVEVTP